MFSNKFIKTIPPENSGANTSNAFDFQKNWSMWLLLDCHENMPDYLIVFDYHDDVVVFNSETDAAKADFYQIKTKNQNHWTLSELTTKGKKKNSIIGKMYSNKLKFECVTNSTNLITNASAPFNITLEKQDINSLNIDCICCKELSSDAKAKIQSALKIEYDSGDEKFEDILFFKVSDLNIRGHREQTIGRLQTFLEKCFPDKKCKTIPFYNALFAEIANKTDYGKLITEYGNSLKRKSLSQSDFSKMLNDITIKRDFTELWVEVNQSLLSENISPITLRNLRDEWDKLEIHLMNRDNALLQKVFTKAKSLVTELRQSGDITTITGLLETVISILHGLFKDLPVEYNQNYLKAIVLAAFYE